MPETPGSKWSPEPRVIEAARTDADQILRIRRQYRDYAREFLTAGEPATKETQVEIQQSSKNDEADNCVLGEREKISLMMLASFSALISPISSSIYFPAVNDLSRDLHVSVSSINLTISTYLIFQGIAPSFTAALSEAYGRRPAYMLCFVVYLGANIGLALQNDYAALLVLRCLQSSGSSGTVALGSAVVADLSTRAERGKYIGYVSMGVTLGPALGPVVGGLLEHFLGWRWIFWFLVIFSATFGLIMAMLNRETCIIALYGASLFAGYSSVLSVLTSQLQERFGFNSIQIGLCYLPLGAGSLTSRRTVGFLLDRNFRREAGKQGLEIVKNRQQDISKFNIEKARIMITMPFVLGACVFIIAYGWTMEFKTSLAAPLVMLFFVSHLTTGAFTSLNTLVTDINREQPATASAASNLCRCLLAAGAVAAATPIINAIGIGWASTICAFVWVACSPMIWLVYTRGHRWRKEKAEKEASLS
ncbi:MFS transporter R5 [Pseudocercospora fuligena]|uniref:MFS transporter R5 n=1 Tax=Pseudocercospora fuligena TaxID=685502 RepID=A0A8H6RKR9_9PEZI|nr:MFS transporter R5 [Pseudocercospora fuligena]